ncbi:hypothetical protein [Streptomyces sp. NPDC001250]
MAPLRLTFGPRSVAACVQRLLAPDYDTRAARRLSDEPADGREEQIGRPH